MKTFKKWMARQFDKAQLADLAHHDAMSGFSGLRYYAETTKFDNKYQEEIDGKLYAKPARGKGIRRSLW